MSFISRIFSSQKKAVASKTASSLDDPYKIFENRILVEIYDLKDPAKASNILVEIEAKKAGSYDEGFRSTLDGLETQLKDKADSLIMELLSGFFTAWNKRLNEGVESAPYDCKKILEHLHSYVAHLNGLCRSEFKKILKPVNYIEKQDLPQERLLLDLINTAEELNYLSLSGISRARNVISNSQYWENVKYITGHKISAETSIPLIREQLVKIQQEFIRMDKSANLANPDFDTNKNLRNLLLTRINDSMSSIDYLLRSLKEKPPHFEKLAQQILPIENPLPILEKKIGEVVIMHGTTMQFANMHVTNGLPAKAQDGLSETYFSVDGTPHGAGIGRCYLMTKIKHVIRACAEKGESFAYYNDEYYICYFAGKALFMARKDGNTKDWENKLLGSGYCLCVIAETHKLLLPYVVLFGDAENAESPAVGQVLSRLPKVVPQPGKRIQELASNLL